MTQKEAAMQHMGAPEGMSNRMVKAIKPDYARVRRLYLAVDLAGAIVVLLLQIALYLEFKFHWLLPLQFKDPEIIHLLKYLIVPSLLNFSAVLTAWLLHKYYKGSELILNTAPVLAMVVICSATASAHSVYSVTLMVMSLPVFMGAIYGMPKLTYITSGACAVGLVSAAFCRHISPYWKEPLDTKYVPEVISAYAFLFLTTAVARVMIILLNAQKERLVASTRAAAEARQEAQVANQAKTEFLANMSHEIRTPLNAVIGMTEIIARKSTEPEIQEYAGDIQQASNLLLSIINDILDISKIESGRLDIQENRYELGSLINDSYNMVAVRCREKGLAMEVVCDPGLPRMLYGDEYHLRQIIVNLLSNAVKYTREGGIEFYVAGEEHGEILRMEIRVKDTGIGIQAEDIPHLFDKFSRMDLQQNRKVEGTGLGLAITKQLVDLMGGTIEVESVYGEGSVFTVRIPQKIADGTPIGDVYATYLDVHGEVEHYHQSFEAPEATILVVDDVAINLQVIRRLLGDTKVQVDTASSGLECLKKAVERRYDVILMDHMMPELDGVQTLEAMKKLPESKNQGVPVIMLTANAMVGAREGYLEQGFVDYLAKPVRGGRLEAMILKYLPPEKVVRIEAEDGTPAGGGLEDLCRLLPELDTASGMAYCADDKDFYCSMLGEFAAGERDKKLCEAYEAADWGAYQLEAHSLKSSARMVGLPKLSEEALILEDAAKRGDEDTIRARHGQLTEHYRTVVKILDSLQK